MGNFRPITDTWIMARPKLLGGRKYYGAYPSGFLGRARDLIGCGPDEPMLHVCGGLARFYPYRGFGQFDRTMDMDWMTEPDYCQDARDPFPLANEDHYSGPWPGILIDPPYSAEDAKKYRPGAKVLPTRKQLLTRAVEVLRPGRKVGILHYLWARPVPGLRMVAIITVYMGFDNRPRAFTVFEKE